MFDLSKKFALPDTLLKSKNYCTEVRIASFLSGGFTTVAVMNPLEKKLKKRTSVHCINMFHRA